MTFPLILPAQGIREYPSPQSFLQRGTSPLNVAYAGAVNQTAHGTLSSTVDVLRAYPVVVPGGVVDTLYMEATAVIANAVGRCGIYRNQDDHTLYPTSLYGESGEFALATAVVRSASVTLTIPPGLCWFVTLTGVAAPTLRAIAVGGMSHILGMSSAFARQFYYEVAYAYAALPASFPASATFEGTDACPLMATHFA